MTWIYSCLTRWNNCLWKGCLLPRFKHLSWNSWSAANFKNNGPISNWYALQIFLFVAAYECRSACRFNKKAMIAKELFHNLNFWSELTHLEYLAFNDLGIVAYSVVNFPPIIESQVEDFLCCFAGAETFRDRADPIESDEFLFLERFIKTVSSKCFHRQHCYLAVKLSSTIL